MSEKYTLESDWNAPLNVLDLVAHGDSPRTFMSDIVTNSWFVRMFCQQTIDKICVPEVLDLPVPTQPGSYPMMADAPYAQIEGLIDPEGDPFKGTITRSFFRVPKDYSIPPNPHDRFVLAEFILNDFDLVVNTLVEPDDEPGRMQGPKGFSVRMSIRLNGPGPHLKVRRPDGALDFFYREDADKRWKIVVESPSVDEVINLLVANGMPTTAFHLRRPEVGPNPYSQMINVGPVSFDGNDYRRAVTTHPNRWVRLYFAAVIQGWSPPKGRDSTDLGNGIVFTQEVPTPEEIIALNIQSNARLYVFTRGQDRLVIRREGNTTNPDFLVASTDEAFTMFIAMTLT
ncbi:MAG: hypothetical protein EOP83_16215 [Verrucomicrobiaceae bacterium]|nr:MAG: hypothetical protein EOP83_16215 [Verrucomicrobiaceae bacterium]